MIALAAAAALLAFDPVEFFRGRTHGEGTVKAIFQAAKALSVDSLGFEDKDGTLVVKQVIHESAKPDRTRYWRLKALGGGRYEGTLTDAASRVRIEQKGDSIRIRYKAQDHLDFDQTLTPEGPRAVANKMKVKRFGIVVARVEETIRKLD
jgi:hypothetical protein